MAEFYRTGYGTKFFDQQLPALIAQLKRIADALEKQADLHEKSNEE